VTEPLVRLLVLAVIALLVGIAVWRRRRVHTVLPKAVQRSDLAPGVHFFASSTCSTCVPARRALTAVYGSAFTETVYETDPTRFAALGIESVPTVYVLGSDGTGLRWEGVPRRRALPRHPGGS